jgi:hypothetical protein
MSVVVRAKFKVDAIKRLNTHNAERQPDGTYKHVPLEMRTVEMSPVYSSGDPHHENTKFWQASPSGKLELGCINLQAAERFELGREYYIDFTPAN